MEGNLVDTQDVLIIAFSVGIVGSFILDWCSTMFHNLKTPEHPDDFAVAKLWEITIGGEHTGLLVEADTYAQAFIKTTEGFAYGLRISTAGDRTVNVVPFNFNQV